MEKKSKKNSILTISFSTERLNEIEKDILASSSKFLRIHQSYFINCDYVKEATSGTATLNNGRGEETVLKISRERQKDVRARLFSVLGEEIRIDD